MSYPTCLICGKKIKTKGTGRPPSYCTSDSQGRPTTKCKEKARRNRDKDRNQAARQTLETMDPEPIEIDSGVTSDVVCRVCDTNPATVGPPGNPILCEGCARA